MKPVQQKILIVDDESDILTLLGYNLKQAGYKVLPAGDGPEALEMAESEHPDLILLDIMLPSMDGTEVCRRLKGNERTSAIPVIMLTAKGEEVDRIVGLELGAEDYITKPFSPRELVLRVKAVLKRSRPIPEEAKVLRIGDIEIDLGSREVTINSKVIGFTATEFKLLAALAEGQGKTIARDTLLDKVWGGECYLTDRTVDTHIRRLRKKLGDQSDCLETVRGFGYRMRGNNE